MSKRKTPPEGNSPVVSVKKKATANEGGDRPQSFLKENYASLYSQVQGDSTKRQELFSAAVAEENYYRELFAQERDSQTLNENYLFMLNVFKNPEIFQHVKESEEEAKIPKLHTIEVSKKEGAAVVSHKQFTRQFELFTEHQLRGLDWSNVFAAGGSVLACLQPIPAPHNANNIAIRNYYHKEAYKNSDIDLFVYGLTEEEANKKMSQIFDTIKNNLIGGEEVIAFRSLHAVTIISRFPYRHIQIVLRLYKSPAEVLMGFDVDSCAVGYDGKDVWVSPRAHHALTYQLNTVDMTRRSPSYEMRLAKYCGRGFGVAIPSLQLQRIDPLIYEKRFDQVQGLAKLLLLTKLEKQTFRFRYKEQQRMRKLRPEVAKNNIFDQIIDDDDEYNAERLEGGESASDYSTVFLPWGPKWHGGRIRKLMYTKDLILNSKWYDPTKKYHTHPCFFGTIEEILKDCCGSCPPVPEKDVDPDSPFVSGPLTWVTINPGQQTQVQRIGSFHPITEGDWTEGAYINAATEQLFAAVNSNNVDKLKKLLEEDVDINSRDATGRTLLHIAIMSNSTEAAAILIKKGARISAKMIDGRSPVHLAAQYNTPQILRLLIERGAELEESNANKKDDKMDEEKDEDEEEEEEEEKEEDDEEIAFEDSIKARVDQMKKEQQEKEDSADPTIDKGDDLLEIDAIDWDYQVTPLQYAAFFGHDEIIEVLIDEGGADIKMLTQNLGITIVMVAIINNHPSTVKLLLQKGYPINHLDKSRRNALHYLSSLKHPSIEIAQILIENNVDVNATCDSRVTPLLLALERVKTPNQGSHYSRGGRRKRAARGIWYDNSQEEKSEVTEEEKNINMKLEHVEEDLYQFIKFLVKNGATIDFTPQQIATLQQVKMNKPAFAFPVPSRKAKKRADSDEDEEDEDDMEDEDDAEEEKESTEVAASPAEQLRFESPIKVAVRKMSIRLLKLFIRNGANVNSIFSDYNTLLDVIVNILGETKEKSSKRGRKKNDADDEFKKSEFDKKKEFLEKVYTEFQKENNVFYKHLFSAAFDEAKNYVENSMLSDEDRKKYTREYHKTISTLAEKKLHQERAKHIKEILEKNGAKKLVDLALPADFTDCISQQNYRISLSKTITNFANYGEDVVKEFKQAFSYSFENTDSHYPQPGDKKKAIYEKLYEAILNNDLDGIDASTIKIKKGTPAIVCSEVRFRSDYNHNRTLCDFNPLQLAIQLNYADVTRRLLTIAKSQHTPRAQKSKDQNAAINNYSLTQMMRQGVKIKHYLNDEGKLDDDEEEDVDPNSTAQFISFVGPKDLIESEENSLNIFHYAAIFNSVDACNVLFEFIEQNIEKPAEFIQKLLLPEESYSFRYNPFQLAITKGHLEIASLFLQYGGGIKSDYEEFEYEGLDVGGKKMDWVKDHNKVQKKPVSPLIVAAFSDQPAALEFLVTKAPAIWKNYYLKLYPDTSEDEFQSPSEFNLKFSDKVFGVPLRCATLEVTKKILELDSSIVDMFDFEGVTALQRACYLGENKKAEVLLENGASITLQSKKGWNALHFAAEKGNKETLALLLSECTKPEVNSRALKSLQTPLFVACSSENKDYVQMLLEKGADPLIPDVAGDLPLHVAVKESNVKIVELLLRSIFAEYNAENGVGYTPFDYAIINLISDYFKSNSSARKQNKIVQTLLEKLKGHRRIVTTSDLVRNVTESMLQKAIDDVHAKAAEARERDYSRRKRFSKISGAIAKPEVPTIQPFILSVTLAKVDDIFKSRLQPTEDDAPNVVDNLDYTSDSEPTIKKAEPVKSSGGGKIVGKHHSYVLYPVKSDVTISQFVKNTKVPNWAVGNGFYPLTSKSEAIEKKDVVLISKSDPSVCIDDKDQILKELKLAKNAKVNDRTTNKYTIYLQSTSHTRKLLGGTKLLVIQD